MISRDEIAHIARLASLKLTEEEKDKFSEQLSDVLDYINQICEVDTSGVEPTYYPLPSSNILREDEVTNQDRRQDMLEQAPDKEDDQFKVPGIEQKE